MADEQRVAADRVEPGQWLPLERAVRVLGISERAIYQLVGQGKLRSRDGANDGAEIWITDSERTDTATERSVEVIHQDQSLFTVERLSAAMSQQVASLTAPLAASYERNVQLARENGALTERLDALEREAQELRSGAVSRAQALEQAQKRLEALEGANAALTRMLAAAQRDVPEERRSPWLLLVGVAILLVLAIVAVAVLQPGSLSSPFR
jgi:hypothetical protein